jgi:archaemetzincin
LVGPLAADLARTFQVPCEVVENRLDPSFAFNPEREQYYSTAILERLSSGPWADTRVLGVTPLDLYVPILTFVFGEAQLQGRCAVVSSYRLAEPGRPELLYQRLLKEASHELGHTFGLRHCHDWDCVMSSSHAVERLDIKSSAFCPTCLKAVRA